MEAPSRAGSQMNLCLPLTCGAVVTLLGCSYTHETATSRTRLALFSNNARNAYGETEHVSSDVAKVAGVGAAAYMKSALAAAAIALPEVSKSAVEAVRLSSDGTTNTVEAR